MPNLKDIRRRIKSVKNTQQITKAMKLVSASKLRKAQEAILGSRPYAIKLMEAISHLATRCNYDLHPFLSHREDNKTLYLVITADKGLCGGFNGNIIRKTNQEIQAHANRESQLILAGKKGNDFFKTKDIPILKDYIGWTREFNYALASKIADDLAEEFANKSVDRVYVVYNEFKSVIQQDVVIEQLLPVVPEYEVKEDEHQVDYEYEPDAEEMLDSLLQRYMRTQVFRAFLESAAGEHGARMTAMDSASRNAGEMIGSLTLQYNQARQAYITKELIEIVNGAEALKA
ncbi:MAG: ATP synthase F1 subunit gamma [Candidatus Nitrohelix vancouverensis]|uniref:ATP synthase gamma chain n=1 Tax=Candidatus Nitrohelix vancouverensis TaxID=2705534 RepID=A0A7T0G3M3_9BACT|nr:MAG: ATP synthase F1 subunit gamma [Candidatus Nitrohelix vancouverensis]